MKWGTKGVVNTFFEEVSIGTKVRIRGDHTVDDGRIKAPSFHQDITSVWRS